MGDYRSLRAWERAHHLTLEVYQATQRFPPEEAFGLTSQMRRAAASIPANLAEGAGRNSRNEMARYGRIALGSANELDYHLLLARDLGYLMPDRYADLAERVDHLRRMLARFIKTLRSDLDG